MCIPGHLYLDAIILHSLFWLLDIPILSEIHLTYLEIVWSFQVSLLLFVRQIQSNTPSRAIVPTAKQDVPEYFTQYPRSVNYFSLTSGNKYYSQLYVSNWQHFLILPDGFSLASDVFLAHTLMHKLKNTWRRPSARPQGLLSVEPSTLQHCVLETLAILVSLDSHLGLLNSGSFQAPARLSLTVFCPGNSLKIAHCGNLRVCLTPFLSLSFIVSNSQLCFIHYFSPSLLCFR